jgi:molecular chaperone DnaJ
LALDGKTRQDISARVPAGVKDGVKIRVKGKGAPGEAGPGDLFILLTVTPHPIFSRNGENITLTVPVTFVEAALGADIKVPTLSGDDVTLRLAPGTPTGRVLRVKGRGVTKGSSTGDLLVTIEVQIPQRLEGEALDTLKKFAELTEKQSVRDDLIAKALL